MFANFIQSRRPIPSECQVPWRDDPEVSHGAGGERDVLVLVSNESTADNPDIVPRRSRGPLTEEERMKLEEQGIHRDLQHTDLSIMTSRITLDERCKVVKMLPNQEMNCLRVKKGLANLLNNTHKEGGKHNARLTAMSSIQTYHTTVILHYIGPGKKGTGDWCFSDGFISFREIMNLYTQHFRGRVLTIISDCSYSGSWVREAMTFMDEQGVGPCGHVAKEMGFLVKVYSSSLANEIPAELAFSTNCAKNNASTGILFYAIDFRSKEIHDGQHPSGLDFTRVRCRNKIDQPCTMAPGSTWDQWSTAERIFLVRGEDRGRPAWHYVKVEDNEDTRKAFFEAVASNNVNVKEFGEPIKCGWGKDSPEEVKKKILEEYIVKYDYSGN